MKNFLFFLLIFSVNFVFAQKNVTGIISDKSGKPVVDVRVSVKNANNQTFTDSDGKYSIKIPENCKTLEFSKQTFRVQEVEISGNVVNITLTSIYDVKDIFELSLEELMQVEVTTASKTSQKISDVPASVVVVSREEIERYGFKTFEEILENITGIYITDDLFYKTVSVRGFWSPKPNHIVILINGVPQYGFYESAVLSAMFIPVQSIERIEIIRGPMSVIYGSGAFFGAINVITNTSVSENPQSNISASLGSLETNKLSVNIRKNRKTSVFR